MTDEKLTVKQAEKLLLSWAKTLASRVELLPLTDRLSAGLKPEAEKAKREIRSELPGLMEEVNGAFDALNEAIQRDGT